MKKDEMVKVLRYKAANIKAHIHPSFFTEIADYLETQKADVISRKAVDALVDELARAISDERLRIPRGRSTGEIMQDILDLPSVDPDQKTVDHITLKDAFENPVPWKLTRWTEPHRQIAVQMSYADLDIIIDLIQKSKAEKMAEIEEEKYRKLEKEIER